MPDWATSSFPPVVPWPGERKHWNARTQHSTSIKMNSNRWKAVLMYRYYFSCVATGNITTQWTLRVMSTCNSWKAGYITAFPFFVVLSVCSTPGHGQFPASLYPWWRDQQAEAHWTPHCPLPSDLILYLSFTLTKGASVDWIVSWWSKETNVDILCIHIQIKLWSERKKLHCNPLLNTIIFHHQMVFQAMFNI